MRSLFTAFSVHNSLLGACWGWRAWIAIAVDDTLTFDGIVIQRILYEYDLYICFSTNINVVILLTGFLASLIIWIFCLPTLVLWGLYMRCSPVYLYELMRTKLKQGIWFLKTTLKFTRFFKNGFDYRSLKNLCNLIFF